MRASAVGILLALGDAAVTVYDFSAPQDTNFYEVNDPVMGGASSGTFSVNSADGYGRLNGTVALIPYLSAPGFIKAIACDEEVPVGRFQGGVCKKPPTFPDISAQSQFVIRARSNSPGFKGFRFSFNNYKADFNVTNEWSDILLPFTAFSNKWSQATGDATTTCSDDPSVCPTPEALAKIKDIEFWAEGHAGDVTLDVQTITADASSQPLELSADEIILESFDAAMHSWSANNDPVMGGKSTSTFTIKDGIGTMNGTCAIVPSLDAPGFITAVTTDSVKFPDISTCQGLTLTTRSQSTPANYQGYRVSFGTDSAFLSCGKFFARGFKSDFTAGEGEFSTVQIPFDKFTKCWDDSTGDAVKTCEDFPKFCPTQDRLKDLQTISLWAEGHEADVRLDVKKIGAYGCSTIVV
jgi:hypothetical protein